MWWIRHPPSCVDRCHTDAIPEMNDGLQVLGPRHHAAIRLKLDGASGREIADALDVQTRTVYLWMGDPLVKEELARQLDRIGDVFAREIALALIPPSRSSGRWRSCR